LLGLSSGWSHFDFTPHECWLAALAWEAQGKRR